MVLSEPVDKLTITPPIIPTVQIKSSAAPPLLSVVILGFLKRHDQNKKANFTKLVVTLPIFLDLVGDRLINQLLQADINGYFDEVQSLPLWHHAKIFAA
ncbi:hypothetical protein [Methylomicrobium lacus]|uniref:hypothetical protein n=1 Tax=Methylomicrobium lacus TaxID=136992 RepID=UPI0035A9516D